MFFGTPHKGGNGVSFGKLVANIASIVLDTNAPILDHLKKDNESLEQQSDHYTLIADQFDTKFFYETVKTTRFGVSLMVVLTTTSSPSTTTNVGVGSRKIFSNRRRSKELRVNRNAQESYRDGEDEEYQRQRLSNRCNADTVDV